MDECGSHTDNCDINAECTNTVGSYNCSCNVGYSGDGASCLGIKDFAFSISIACYGYLQPADVDECALRLDNCDIEATCSNTQGSFSCTCNPGWSGSGTTCAGMIFHIIFEAFSNSFFEDVDECADAIDDCDQEASCTNTPGSFTCACNDGFIGDGRSCSSMLH